MPVATAARPRVIRPTPADAMYEVIRNTTSQLTAQDLDAVVAYLRSLRPLPDEPK